MSVCCTEPECSWRERRVKVQLGADASVQAGEDVTLKENAVYSVLDTSSSAAVAANTGVDIDPVRARASLFDRGVRPVYSTYTCRCM